MVCLPVRCPEYCVNGKVVHRQLETLDGVLCTICECEQQCPDVNCNLPQCDGETIQVPNEAFPGCLKCVCACSLIPPMCPDECAMNVNKQLISIGQDGCQVCKCRRNENKKVACPQNICDLCKKVNAKKCKICKCDKDEDDDEIGGDGDDDDDDEEEIEDKDKDSGRHYRRRRRKHHHKKKPTKKARRRHHKKHRYDHKEKKKRKPHYRRKYTHRRREMGEPKHSRKL